MSYIIIWRNTHRDPVVHTDNHDFIEHFYSYEEAKATAEACVDNDDYYHDYQIYQEAED